MTGSLNRRHFLAFGGALLLGGRPASATDDLLPLYRARTIVTGKREETRIPGMKLCLRHVLVRVSGDPRLADHPGVSALDDTPDAAVKSYDYRDLYAFRPIKDEQGTRDRPYEMTVIYDTAKIDAMLMALGSRPWLEPRPKLMIFLAVRHIGTNYVLSAGIPGGSLQRESFELASYRFAMPVAFPPIPKLQAAKLSFETLPQTPLADLERLAQTWGGEKALGGTLNWSREELGWIAEWRLEAGGIERRWKIAGVNFDAAFRVALGGAAQILSGNGTPA